MQFKLITVSKIDLVYMFSFLCVPLTKRYKTVFELKTNLGLL